MPEIKCKARLVQKMTTTPPLIYLKNLFSFLFERYQVSESFCYNTFINVGFSRYNLYAIITSACSSFKWVDLYAIATCTSWGICISFHAALLFDPTCFRRIATKMKLSMRTFYVANFVMHVLPCIITLCFRVRYIFWWHGWIASAIHLSWGCIRSRGTMCLDELYVPMTRNAWYFMWTVSVVTEIIVSLSPTGLLQK